MHAEHFFHVRLPKVIFARKTTSFNPAAKPAIRCNFLASTCAPQCTGTSKKISATIRRDIKRPTKIKRIQRIHNKQIYAPAGPN